MTSPKDGSYNCIAHAADDQDRWWDSSGFPGYYWPEAAKQGDGAESLASCFAAIGYERCAGGDHEEGYEKVALYVDDRSEWTHAARQLANGEWTSKLGTSFDIRHASPHCFGGSVYGNVLYFMKRPVGGENGEAQDES